MNTRTSLPWFAIRVRSRSEKAVSQVLADRGFTVFLPYYLKARRWSDRSVTLTKPLFPGYLFCRVDLDRRLPLLTTPGVLEIVGYGRSPIPVAPSEIEAIQMLVASPAAYEPCAFMQRGQAVRFNRGPLAGLEGILVDNGKRSRVVVSVTLLQRSVAVEIDSEAVEAVNAIRKPPGSERVQANTQFAYL
jgi:transcription antitermination factor NusG